jgi:prepilin-type N-terminal cleavage/methylation domain-containing protein
VPRSLLSEGSFLKASKKSAFTLIELLIVIAIIALLAGLLFPVVAGVLAQSRATKCGKNLRQLATTALLYAADHEMTLPVTVHQRKSGGKSWRSPCRSMPPAR